MVNAQAATCATMGRAACLSVQGRSVAMTGAEARAAHVRASLKNNVSRATASRRGGASTPTSRDAPGVYARNAFVRCRPAAAMRRPIGVMGGMRHAHGHARTCAVGAKSARLPADAGNVEMMAAVETVGYAVME